MARTSKTPITSAAVYARLSQDRNGDSLGIERQADLCEKLAAERGWHVSEVYEERNVSAFSGAVRPSYQRLLTDIAAGRRDAVIAVDQDRLARRLKDLLELIELCDENHVPIVLLSGELDTTTADGVLRAQILGAVAQNESAKKSERICRQREQAAKRGVFMGGRRPYGFEPDGVTHRRDEVKVIRDAARRLVTGESLRSLTLDLNARSIPAPQGGRWRPSGLRDVLIKPRLAGLRVHRGEVIGEATWPPIIDRETHERLVRVLVDHSRTRRGRPATSLLSGLCRCSKCGATLWHARVNGVRAYRCPDRSVGGCNGITIVAEPLEDLITSSVERRLEANAAKLIKRLTRPARSPAVDDDAGDLGGVERDLEHIAADFGAGRLSRREWLAAREPLERRRADLLGRIDAAVDVTALAPFLSALDVADVWRGLDLDRQRGVLAVLINKINVLPAKGGNNTFDQGRVSVVWKA